MVTALVFVVALGVAVTVRGNAVVGIAVLFLLFVPLEKVFALRPQRVFRPALLTDLTHLLVNNLLVSAATVVILVVAALPMLWIRTFDLQSHLPKGVAIAVAAATVLVCNYWGHRLTHHVPFLWRFHAVHHSIEQMDWVASGRLHPLDSAFTQAFALTPVFLLGYGGGTFAGATIFFTLLALFQHANVRIRFPVLRWIVNTPEWHHWHHSVDPEARDKNFGLPLVDLLFGTAYLPRGRRPTGFGVEDPVPAAGYLAHLAYPFRKGTTVARSSAA